MRCLSPACLVLVCFVAGLTSAQEAKKDTPEPARKENVRPREAEVKFADGSTLKVLILDNIEVVTKYGKLNLPASELRRIDFGLHLSEETVRKVEEAVNRLGSDTFQKREEAAKDLVALGALAVPALKNAAKSSDQEVAQRARAALERIKEKVTAAQLNLKPVDAIQTNEFPIVGRVANSVIKARTAYFGDLDLKVVDIRLIRWAGGAEEEQEVSVDADKYGGQDNTWFDTGLTVDSGTPFVLTASGRVDLLAQQQPGNFLSGPEGRKELRHQAGQAAGTLIGKIGESGEVFVVGPKLEKTPNQDGKLYLRIVPFQNGLPGNQASGSYKVKITGSRREIEER